MDNKLLKDTIGLLEKFESENQGYSCDIDAFKRWIAAGFLAGNTKIEPYWEGKENEGVQRVQLIHYSFT